MKILYLLSKLKYKTIEVLQRQRQLLHEHKVFAKISKSVDLRAFNDIRYHKIYGNHAHHLEPARFCDTYR